MIVRVLNDSDVAQDALRRKKTSLLIEDGAQELVCGAKTLHQDITVTIMNKLHGLGDSLQLNRLINDVEHFDVNAKLFTSLGDKVLVSDKSDLNEPHLGSLCAGLDSVLIHGPSRDHLLADTLFFEFRENISEFSDHGCMVIRLLFINTLDKMHGVTGDDKLLIRCHESDLDL